jgi:hypothetical protein
MHLNYPINLTNQMLTKPGPWEVVVALALTCYQQCLVDYKQSNKLFLLARAYMILVAIFIERISYCESYINVGVFVWKKATNFQSVPHSIELNVAAFFVDGNFK